MGVLTIAGPTVRFTPERMEALAPELLSIAARIAAASGASPFFNLTAETGGHATDAGRKPIYAV
jgi:IclR family transcriptional regulator, acetate operon repressor